MSTDERIYQWQGWPNGTGIEEYCPAEDHEYVCTLERGHAGLHEAWGTADKPCPHRAWGDPLARVRA